MWAIGELFLCVEDAVFMEVAIQSWADTTEYFYYLREPQNICKGDPISRSQVLLEMKHGMW